MYRLLLKIFLPFSLLIFALNCSGLISLDLPSVSQQDIEKGWLTLGKNQQHHHNSSLNIHPPLKVVWQKSIKSVITDHPLAIGDVILAPTKSGIMYFVDYKTGHGLGSGKFGTSLEHLPTIYKHTMYGGLNLGDKTLVGFNLKKASKELNKKYPHINTSPIIFEERIYFGTSQKLFFCADLKTGSKIWEYETNSPIHSSPALQDSTIVFGDDHGWLYAVDAATGKELWKAQLEGSIFSHPVLDELTVYIGTVGGKMYALNLISGDIVWEKSFSGAIFSSPSLFDKTIYFGNNAHEVISLQKETGKLNWKFHTKGIVNTVPLPSPDYLYVASWDKNLYMLNRLTGKLVYKHKFRKPLKSSPIIYRDYILVHTANDKLIALANEKLVLAREDKK